MNLLRLIRLIQLAFVILVLIGTIAATLVLANYFLVRPLKRDNGMLLARVEAFAHPNSSGDDVLKLKWEILGLRGNWEAMTGGEDDAQRREIQHWAAQLGFRMLAHRDAELHIQYQIEKYQYAAYAFMMAADVEESNDLRKKYADEGEGSAKSALASIAQVFRRESEDDEKMRIARWIRSDDLTEDRVRVLWAMIIAVQVRNGDSSRKTQGRLLLGQISTYYRRQYLDSMKPILRFLE